MNTNCRAFFATVALLLATAIPAGELLACSCSADRDHQATLEYSAQLLSVEGAGVSTPEVLHVNVLSHEFPAMWVEVIDALHGEEQRIILSVLGDDWTRCRP